MKSKQQKREEAGTRKVIYGSLDIKEKRTLIRSRRGKSKREEELLKKKTI